jgi:peptidyl-prolyl cis-trans isomerase D
MLMQNIRDHATGWIAWVIVILISIPFALWGIQKYLSPTSNDAVAVVNGTDVSINEFQRTYQRQRSQLQSLLGGQFDINQLDEDRLREEALNQLINDEVVLQAAHAEGLRISDQQVAQAVQSQQTFRQDGVFNEALYDQWLRSQGYSSEGFWIDLKRSMMAEQLVAGIASSAIVTERELANIARLQGQKRIIDTLTVPTARFGDVKIEAEAIKAHYEANQVDYVSPEQVKLKFIEVSRDAIAADVDVDDEELRAVYERRKADFQIPEQREASHILLTLPDDADEATVADARARLEALKAQIDNGASFEDLAREHSEDPGSSRQGGSLGGISRGIMDPAFEDAVFSLALNEVSDPVRSAFGLHLIRVDAINTSKVPSFDEVRDKLRAEYQADKAEQIFVDQVETMTTLAFENPDSLEAVADALGLTVNVTDWMSRMATSNSGIGRNPDVLEAAFNPDVLQNGFNSEPIELSPSRVIVLRMAEYQPSQQEPLDKVKEQIERDLAAREARKLAADTGRGILERLQAGEDKQSVATQTELSWSGESEIPRNSADVDEGVLNTAFRLPRPAPGAPVFGGTAIADGDFVIVAVQQVLDGSLAAVDEEQRTAAKRSLEIEEGRAAYDAVVRALRDDADVTIIRENL